jgi:NADP-dependent 3-hydroxy acid dehydrogenase YdfG
MKRRTLKGAVVVLTGASSGIGRATALMFAEEGAKLVLAARDGQALAELARECRDTYGVEAIAAPTDVRDELSVDALGGLAIESFGRVDVWVNDAAIYMMGPLDACPTPAIRELFETNVMGVVHGVRAALACFRVNEGAGGVIINVGSRAGESAYSGAGPYCASKHAVHAITKALRQELRGTGIEACLVVPPTVDTPLFQHAANYTGHEILARRPIYDARRAARAIVRQAMRPKEERRFGWTRLFLAWLYRDDATGRASTGPTSGNFASPRAPHRVDGGWRARRSPGKKLENALRTGALPVLTTGG